MRYIDADALERQLFRDGIAGIFLNYPRRTKFTIGEIRGMLKNERIAPTANVVEVRHGEWKEVQLPYTTFFGGKGEGPYRKCSVCEWGYPVVTVGQHLKKYMFCPNCGAKMDGERSKHNE